MKKILLYLIATPFITFSIVAQQSANLNVNNINTNVKNSLSPFFDNVIDKSTYKVGLDSTNYPIFSTGLFLGGLDENDSIHLSGHRSEWYEDDNFTFGPIGNDYNSGNYQNYNRVWKITSQEIWAHQQGLGTSSSILNWPAHGDVSNGEAFYLAPFIDVDGDGLYNPSNGDYPKIKGDEAVFYIVKDLDTPHLHFSNKAISVEIHVMIYSFQRPTAIINNTTFVNYSIYNRSNIDYSDFYIGSFMDADIGCGIDDYLFCDSTRNTVFMVDDGNVDSTIHSVYLNERINTAIGIKLLNHEMTSTSYSFYNFSMTEEYSFYNRLRGLTPYGTNKVNYFTSNPTTYSGLNGVSEIQNLDSIAEHYYSSHYMFGNMGPYLFSSNSKMCIDLAYVYYAKDSSSRTQNSIDYLLATDTIQDFYDNVNLSCVGFLTSKEELLPKRISTSSYPNPALEQARVVFSRELLDAEVSLQNSLGQVVRKIGVTNGAQVQIERKGLDNGIYFYSIREKGNVIGSGKIVFE